MTKFPQGVRVFAPKENAPSFVKGQIIISIKKFNDWIEQNKDLITDYQGEDQLKLSITERKDGKGWNTIVDTYKPKNDNNGLGDLPF